MLTIPALAKTQSKDYRFFLEQSNFLKVVDTLEKFEQHMLDANSTQAKDFAVFKRQLYQMYQVKNRSVHEHNLFSFQVTRDNLRWLYKANTTYHIETIEQDLQLQAYNNSRLKGAVYKRKTLSPLRVQGLGAFALSATIYSYLPYMAVYLGSTLPILSACAAGIYGLLAFSDSNMVNQIRIVQQGEHSGLLEVDVATTALVSRKILVDVKNVHSVLALDNDNLGEEDEGDNLLEVRGFIDAATGEQKQEKLMLRLPADAYRNAVFMDWIIAEKEQESELADDYQNLLTQRLVKGQALQSTALAILTGPQESKLAHLNHDLLEFLIDKEDPKVDAKLVALE